MIPEPGDAETLDTPNARPYILKQSNIRRQPSLASGVLYRADFENTVSHVQIRPWAMFLTAHSCGVYWRYRVPALRAFITRIS